VTPWRAIFFPDSTREVPSTLFPSLAVSQPIAIWIHVKQREEQNRISPRFECSFPLWWPTVVEPHHFGVVQRLPRQKPVGFTLSDIRLKSGLQSIGHEIRVLFSKRPLDLNVQN
jgi:hypothetical protein